MSKFVIFLLFAFVGGIFATVEEPGNLELTGERVIRSADPKAQWDYGGYGRGNYGGYYGGYGNGYEKGYGQSGYGRSYGGYYGGQKGQVGYGI